MATKVKVIGEENVTTEVLAESIVSVAESMRKLRAGRLNDKCLFLLIQHAAPGKIYLTDIDLVFKAIEALEHTYLKKKVVK